MIERYGEKSGILQMRKHLGWYIKGVRDASSLRERVNKALSEPEIHALLDEAAQREPAAIADEGCEALAVAM
jgi:tRNA-dihydrouridine synthase